MWSAPIADIPLNFSKMMHFGIAISAATALPTLNWIWVADSTAAKRHPVGKWKVETIQPR